MFMSFHLLNTNIGNAEVERKLCYTLPPLLIRTDASRIQTRVYARVEALFPIKKNGNLR
jgi:hypothetical protein